MSICTILLYAINTDSQWLRMVVELLTTWDPALETLPEVSIPSNLLTFPHQHHPQLRQRLPRGLTHSRDQTVADLRDQLAVLYEMGLQRAGYCTWRRAPR